MPHKSLYPSIPIPDVDIFTFLFARTTKPFPDTKELLIDGERPTRSYTYAQLRVAATDFGRSLQALWNWRHGDVLAFYTPNDVDTPALTCGVLWAGGVASPANPLYTVDELAFQLKDSGAKGLVTQVNFLSQAREAARKVGIPEERIVLLGEKADPEGRTRHWSSMRRTSYASRYAQTQLQPKKDLAFLVYSSGTTGLPKGVRLTHTNVVSQLLQNEQMDGTHLRPSGGPGGRGDRLLGVLPFFHIYVSASLRSECSRSHHVALGPGEQRFHEFICRTATLRPCSIRSRQGLPDYPGQQNHLCLCPSAHSASARKTSGG